MVNVGGALIDEHFTDYLCEVSTGCVVLAIAAEMGGDCWGWSGLQGS